MLSDIVTWAFIIFMPVFIVTQWHKTTNTYYRKRMSVVVEDEGCGCKQPCYCEHYEAYSNPIIGNPNTNWLSE